MATNPFGRPGTSVSGAQGETVNSTNSTFADALRNLAQSSAFGTADTANNTKPSVNASTGVNMNTVGGLSSLANATPYPSTATLDNIRQLNTSPAAAGASYGSPSQVGAALAPMTQGASATAPGSGKAAAQGLANTELAGSAKTAFGQSFNPNAYGMAWDNPKAMIQSYFNFNKMPIHSGGLAMAQQQADSMKLLFALLNGSQGAGNLDFGNYLDWSGKYLQNSMTPGGTYASPGQVVNAILNPDPKSPIFNLYYGSDLTPDQQVGNVLSGLRYGLQGSMPAPVLASVLSKAQELGNNFEAWRMTQPDGGYTFASYLQQQGFNPAQFGYQAPTNAK